jgi:hypothetical protein
MTGQNLVRKNQEFQKFKVDYNLIKYRIQTNQKLTIYVCGVLLSNTVRSHTPDDSRSYFAMDREFFS